MLIPREVFTVNGFSWKLPDWQPYQLVIAEWVAFLLCTTCVGIRLYIQWPLIRKRPWGEIWIFVAWLIFLGNVLCYTLEISWGYFNFYPKWYMRAPDLRAAKIAWANAFLYLTLIYACKASLLCFYSELAPRHLFPGIRWAMNTTWALIFLGVISQILWLFLQCRTFSHNWRMIPNRNCYDPPAKFWTIWGFHIGTDLIIYAIPFFILRRLANLGRRQKIEAGLLFGFGFVNIVLAALAMIFMTYKPANTPMSGHWGLGGFLFTHLCQQATAIIITCAPYVRKFVRVASMRKMRRGLSFWKKSTPTSTNASSAVVEMSAAAERAEIGRYISRGTYPIDEESSGTGSDTAVDTVKAFSK